MLRDLPKDIARQWWGLIMKLAAELPLFNHYIILPLPPGYTTILYQHGVQF